MVSMVWAFSLPADEATGRVAVEIILTSRITVDFLDKRPEFRRASISILLLIFNIDGPC